MCIARIICLLWVGLLPVSVRADQYFPYPAGEEAACGQSRTLKDILAILKLKKPKNKKEAIAALPPEYRRHYVAMLNSDSSQAKGVSPKLDPAHKDFGPRYIGIGRRGSPIVAATDNPADPTLELMDVDAQTGVVTQMAKIDFSRGEAVYQEKSPQSTAIPPASHSKIASGTRKNCKGCHGEPLRYLWDSYPFWPGALGENHDNLESGLQNASWLKLKDQTQSKPKKLAPFPNSIWSQMGPPTSYCFDVFYGCFLKEQPKRDDFGSNGCPEGSRRASPNEAFGSMLSSRNAKRVAELIVQDEKLKPYRYALLAASSCPASETHQPWEGPRAFLPQSAYAKVDWDKLAQATHQRVNQNLKVNAEKILAKLSQKDRDFAERCIKSGCAKFNSSEPDSLRSEMMREHGHLAEIIPTILQCSNSVDSMAVEVSNYRGLVENLAGSEMKSWMMDAASVIGTPTYDFNQGLGGLRPNLEATLWKKVLDCQSADDKDICNQYANAKYEGRVSLYGASYGYIFDNKKELCELLNERSKKSLLKLYPTRPPEEKAKSGSSGAASGI